MRPNLRKSGESRAPVSFLSSYIPSSTRPVHTSHLIFIVEKGYRFELDEPGRWVTPHRALARAPVDH